jgi:hypothetical protein
MKLQKNSVQHCNRITMPPIRSKTRSITFFVLSFLMLSALMISCKKETADVISEEPAIASLSKVFNLKDYPGLPNQTAWELQQARAATAKYQNIRNALKDGYVDINVISQNMGHHYMNPALVDENFEITRPEILVYQKHPDGNFELVAVEYAVPINLPRPEGFSGSLDVWDGNSPFPFWLLHAWVWKYNPQGVFNPTNPLVHQH